MNSLQARIRARMVVALDGCWLWTGTLYEGYGRISVASQQIGAHRASWFAFFGRIPEGMSVLHRCDNPRCVNPQHLFLGTQEDNMHDMAAKGRAAKGDRNGTHTRPERRPRGGQHGTHTKPASVPRGERHCRAKLSDADAAEIRRARAAGVKGVDLAARYGVCQATISEIFLNRKRRGLAQTAQPQGDVAGKETR